MRVIPYRNFNKVRNLGDSFNHVLIEHVSGLPAFFSFDKRPHIIPAGSILFAANERSYIWGAGLLNEDKATPRFDGSNVRVLRGKLTARALAKRGYAVPDVPLGDPGIFADELIDPWAGPPTARVAVVPHYSSWNAPVFQSLAANRDVAIVDMMSDDIQTLKTLQAAEIVVSQSLHGLIFGEALGKPTTWISARDDDSWCFKFRDWQSLVANPQRNPMSLNAPLSEWEAAAERRQSLADKAAIRAAFPLEEVAVEVEGAAYIAQASCRAAAPLVILSDVFVSSGERCPEAVDEARAEEIRVLLRRVLKTWSYPVYTAVVSPDLRLGQEELLRIARFMDENSGFEFVSIVLGPPSKKGQFHRSEAGSCRGVMVRPSRRFNPSSKCATYFA